MPAYATECLPPKRRDALSPPLEAILFLVCLHRPLAFLFLPLLFLSFPSSLAFLHSKFVSFPCFPAFNSTTSIETCVACDYLLSALAWSTAYFHLHFPIQLRRLPPSCFFAASACFCSFQLRLQFKFPFPSILRETTSTLFLLVVPFYQSRHHVGYTSCQRANSRTCRVRRRRLQTSYPPPTFACRAAYPPETTACLATPLPPGD